MPAVVPDVTPDVPLTTPRGTRGLVHLRDGKVLSDYGLVNESVVYVCLDK